MSTIVNRTTKGSPLTNDEVDNNFTNLNTDKLQKSGGTSNMVLMKSSNADNDIEWTDALTDINMHGGTFT